MAAMRAVLLDRELQMQLRVPQRGGQPPLEIGAPRATGKRRIELHYGVQVRACQAPHFQPARRLHGGRAHCRPSFYTSLGRKSRTRTALPCERGISPGLLTATLVLMPIIDLILCRAAWAMRSYASGTGETFCAASTSTVTSSRLPLRSSTSW